MNLITRVARLEAERREAGARAADRGRPLPEAILDTPEQIDAAERLGLFLRSVPEPRPACLAVPPHLIADCELLGLPLISLGDGP